jgi:hypothetical protein
VSSGESETESYSKTENVKEERKEDIETTSPHNPVAVPCDSDYGCAHDCSMVKYDYDVNPVVQW